jgi:hypothetical protein
MSSQIEKFVMEFFTNIKGKISWEFAPKGVPPAQMASADADKGGNVLIIEDVPRGFEDLYGKTAPYRFSFISGIENSEFVGKGSSLLAAIQQFLKGAGKTTLLKIDFDVDPMVEIDKALSLKNCEINSLVKKYKNSFFSRFTFMTTFRYLNESEQVVNEIYVHDGKIVAGDLSGYRVLEGESQAVSQERVKEDYAIAKNILKDFLVSKTNEIGEALGRKVEEEVERIQDHYSNLLGELGKEFKKTVEKINEIELALGNMGGAARGIPSKEGTDEVPSSSGREVLLTRLDRLKKILAKIEKEGAVENALKEKEFTIKDTMHKHSLNIDNKLVNTTVIYYPVFSFNLFLKGDSSVARNSVPSELGAKVPVSSGRFVEMNYDPLTRTLNKLVCESCGKDIVRLNLCAAGHISCDDCLEKCGECGKSFCGKCLKRSCLACGKLLCKDCAIMCGGCRKYVCENHMRKDCVSGDDRCVSCLRACLRCNGLANSKYFGEALDGSKICQKCLGAEKRGEVMKNIFDR